MFDRSLGHFIFYTQTSPANELSTEKLADDCERDDLNIHFIKRYMDCHGHTL